MTFQFSIKKLSDVYNNINHNEPYKQMFESSSFYYQLQQYLGDRFNDFPFYIPYIYSSSNINCESVIWTFDNINQIFYNNQLGFSEILSLNDIEEMSNKIEIKSYLFGHNLNNGVHLQCKESLKNFNIDINGINIQLIKDLFGDIHCILPKDLLNEYNIFTCYINGSYVLLTSSPELNDNLTKLASSFLLRELKESND